MWKTLSIQQENKNERWKRQRQNGICQVGCERDWEKVEKEEEEKKKKVETVQGMWIKSGARIEGVKKKGNVPFYTATFPYSLLKVYIARTF